jgi:hypothetical protein
MKGKHWRKTTLMLRSKQTKEVIIVIIMMISLIQIYVAIENWEM